MGCLSGRFAKVAASARALTRIAPDGRGFELRTFECPKCDQVHVERVPTDPIAAKKFSQKVLADEQAAAQAAKDRPRHAELIQRLSFNLTFNAAFVGRAVDLGQGQVGSQDWQQGVLGSSSHLSRVASGRQCQGSTSRHPLPLTRGSRYVSTARVCYCVN
jgi:hypothetical protein